MSRVSPFALLATFALAGGPAAAAAQQADASPWGLIVNGGYVHQFETDADGGGAFSVGRGFGNATVGYAFDRRTALGFGVSYRHDSYDFGGSGPLAGLDPWSDVHELRLYGALRFGIGERVDMFLNPQIAWSAETGAGFGDAFQAGAIAGATYTFSDRLRLGAGLGAFSEIEEDASVFPVLLVDWQVTDTLSLSTTPAITLTRGPTLNAIWRPIERWTFSLGGGYESYRFRLETEDRVGEEEAFPVFAAVSYEPVDDLVMSLAVGASLAGELRLDDANGNRLARDDFDAAPFLGFRLRARF